MWILFRCEFAFLIVFGDKLERNNLFCLLFTFHLIWFKFELWINSFVTPSNSNTISTGGECVTCRWSKLTNSLGKQQLALSTRTWSGRANRSKFLCQPSWSKRFFQSFFFYFWFGRYNKTLSDWSRGKQWVLFPFDFNVEGLGETKLTFSLRASYILLTSSNQRLWECVRRRINVYTNTLTDLPSWLSTSKNQLFFINNRDFTERYFSDKVHASLIEDCVTWRYQFPQTHKFKIGLKNLHQPSNFVLNIAT